jgi:NAD(P)H dehydrogenase (quinone)
VPAAVKGWFDRVLAMGFAYGGGLGIYETGPLKGKKAMLAMTTGGPGPTYAPDGFNGDINGVLRPIHRGVFEFCGFSVLRPHMCYAVAHGNDDDRKKLLDEWAARLATITAEQPIVVGRYA